MRTKMKMKQWFAWLLVFCMLAGLFGCGKEAATTPTEAPVETEAAAETEAPKEAAQTVYPVTLTDQAGREVTIAEEPQRVVSGYYITTSMLIALGQQEKLVGIEAKADKRAIYSLAAPELISLPNVGTAKEFDLEGCISLNPELVVLPVKLKEAAASMEELGIPVLLVNPESEKQLSEARDLIAQALNCMEEANALEEFAASVREDLSESLSGVETPSVYLAGNSDLLSTAGASMYQSGLITLAGGVNAAAELQDTYWAQIDYEQLLAWDPDVILLAADAQYTVEEVLADENLKSVKAVVNQKVYQMPNQAESWDSPIPAGILGAAWLASQLHPEQYPVEKSSQLAADFYQTFYGFAYENK